MKKDSYNSYIILGCAFLINSLWNSYITSSGVYFNAFVDYFKSSDALTAWITSSLAGSMGISSEFVNKINPKLSLLNAS